MRNDSSTPSQDLDHHYRATIPHCGRLNVLGQLKISTSRDKYRKYVCRCQMGHLRGLMRGLGGPEQMKDGLNEMISARMCIWGEG